MPAVATGEQEMAEAVIRVISGHVRPVTAASEPAKVAITRSSTVRNVHESAAVTARCGQHGPSRGAGPTGMLSSGGCVRYELPVLLGGTMGFAARQAGHDHLRPPSARLAQVEGDRGERGSRQARGGNVIDSDDGKVRGSGESLFPQADKECDRGLVIEGAHGGD